MLRKISPTVPILSVLVSAITTAIVSYQAHTAAKNLLEGQASSSATGWRAHALPSVAEQMQVFDQALYIGAGIGLTLALVLALAYTSHITTAIEQLRESLGQMGEGNEFASIPNFEEGTELHGLAKAAKKIKARLAEKPTEVMVAMPEPEAELEEKPAPANENTGGPYNDQKEQHRRSVDILLETFDNEMKAVLEDLTGSAHSLHEYAETVVGTAETTTGRSEAVVSATEETANNVRAVAAAAEELSTPFVKFPIRCRARRKSRKAR